MTPWVGDYSWGRPDLHRLHDAGCVGVIRYLGPGNGGRDVTRDEVARIHDAGLALGVVWETTTTAALAGWQAGWHDFDAANRYADSVGLPDDTPIAYAVDTDVTVEQARGPIAETFHGVIARGAHRPVRPYGEAVVLDVLCGELKLMPCGWQCAAWSLGFKSPHRCLYQTWPPVMNATVDHNDMGPRECDLLWHPTLPIISCPPMEDDVTPEDKAEIINGVIARLDSSTADQTATLGQWLGDSRHYDETVVLKVGVNMASLIHDDLSAVLVALGKDPLPAFTVNRDAPPTP